ncbi:hypothetical protein BO79DRAFT_156606 [Aspergillus costaricaensis CBS 115574]|uniref:Uncharacterized protein n=1 Tax=Aspergillus costaricaensis CBS 115574 TaxID=1448317 RepID=A0ACD1I435_9EURO|nr:hypothetical protein BO79DRAFT_156606 [Aspergillus costaricaensis CBS 115574]RAK85049.1 hypothetical protein BO79DRAFT_156606 [Aspergillus costaricaensis CBS 115574]
MKLSKSLPESMRHTLVKASSAIFEPVETILEKSGKTQKAQKLRKLQHQCIGLSEDQWQYINDYFVTEELLHLVLQAREKELQNNKKTKSEQPASDDLNEFNSYKEKLRKSERKLEALNNDVRSTEGVMKLLEWKMGHTPLYRAMSFQRCDSKWGRTITIHTDDFVTLGQVDLIPREAKRYAHSKAVYEGRIEFDPRKERTDKISARLMNAYVWGLDGRRG